MEAVEALKRTTLKSRATRFKTFLDNYENTDKNRYISTTSYHRLEKYDELWQEFHVIQINAILLEANITE